MDVIRNIKEGKAVKDRLSIANAEINSFKKSAFKVRKSLTSFGELDPVWFETIGTAENVACCPIFYVVLTKIIEIEIFYI